MSDSDDGVGSASSGGASASMPLSWMNWSPEEFASSRSETESVLAARRARNRESMRRARQRQRSQLERMKTTVAELEQQYEALCLQKTAPPWAPRDDDDHGQEGEEERRQATALVEYDETQRLGSQNLQLKAHIQGQAKWKLDLRRILDAEYVAERASAAAEAAALELAITRRAYGFRPMNESDLEQAICDSTLVIQTVQARLLDAASSDLDLAPIMKVLGWRVGRLIEGHDVEFVFEKTFLNVRAHDVMAKSWAIDLQLTELQKIKSETRRVEILQALHDHAYVFGRDVRHEDDPTVFRSVFLRFRMAVSGPPSTSSPSSSSDGGEEPSLPPPAPSGYVIGMYSINPEEFIDVDAGSEPVVWADQCFWMEFLSGTDEATGQETCRVRWTGKTNFKSEPHAYRNAADMMHTLLRWERVAIAPVLKVI